jgi:hypothetical protein
LGVFRRIEGIEPEVHRPAMKVAGEDKLYGASLKKEAGVFRDQATLNGARS